MYRARHAAAPRRGRRPVAMLLLLVMSTFAGLSFQTQDRAHAFVPTPLPAMIPGLIAGTAPVLAGVGTVVGTGGAAAATAGGAVALAPVAIVAGAVVATAASVYLGWKWLDGHDPAYADPPATTSEAVRSYTVKDLTWTVTIGEVYEFDATYWAIPITQSAISGVDHGQFREHAYRCKDGTGTPANFFLLNKNDGDPFTKTNLIAKDAVTCNGKGVEWYVTHPDLPYDPQADSGGVIYRGLPGPWQPASTAPGTTTVTTTPTSKCSDGSTVTGAAIVYTGATDPADLPPILAPACPPGTQRIGITTPSTTPDGRIVPDPLTWTAPTIPAELADCAPGGLSAPCTMTLVKTLPDGSKVNCTGTTMCPSPRREPEADGGTYRCTWGPYVRPLADCDVVATDPPKVEAQPTAESNCNLSDFSLNPVSWVVVPLKCLFIPRQSVVNGHATGLRQKWDTTAPGQALAAGDAVFGSVTALKDHVDADGCQGPPFTFPVPFTYDTVTNADGTTAEVQRKLTLYPYTTCNELTQYVLAFAMPLVTAGVYLGGFFFGTRTLLKSVNMDNGVAT
jgi:hypothetical protein